MKNGITQEELAQAVAGYLKGKEVDRTNDASLANLLNETSEAGRTMEYYSDLERKIRALSTDQVDEAVRAHINPKRLIVVAAGDFAGAVPEPESTSSKK
jgi:zinc protease